MNRTLPFTHTPCLASVKRKRRGLHVAPTFDAIQPLTARFPTAGFKL